MIDRVLVTGATGFVGRSLVPRLLAEGYAVRALARRHGRVPPNTFTGAEVVLGDLLDSGSIQRAMMGVTHVVHLAAVADSSDAAANERVNVGGSRVVAGAARDCGVRAVLNISSTCAARDRRAHYGRTKAEAERCFDTLGAVARHLRPTMMYGRGSAEWDIFTGIVRRLPRVPVPGTGSTLLQPVFLGDALDAMVAALRWSGPTRTWDIAGPDPVTVAHLVEATGRAMALHRRILPISPALPLLAARLSSRVFEHPPINVDQVLAFLQDTRVDIGPARADLGFDPRPLEEGLADALGDG